MITWIKSLFGDKTFGAIRSSKWPEFRRKNIKHECEYCQSTFFLELHHIKPFWQFPELELDPTNVCTLCRKCHFLLAHFEDWASWNENIIGWILAKRNKP